jgi:hypothetical protein
MLNTIKWWNKKEPEKMVDNERKGAFYNHFSQDKSTRFGNWLMKNSSEQIFEFAQIQQGCSALEIGQGQEVFADICLGNGIEYLAIEPNAKTADAHERCVFWLLRRPRGCLLVTLIWYLLKTSYYVSFTSYKLPL